ncbi:MAG: tetratricopeptide repeat protein [Chitinivibrionales bacterium]|nr:tetratricopeptide repeat protein [Chitinivibrionales bacterium]
MSSRSNCMRVFWVLVGMLLLSTLTYAQSDKDKERQKLLEQIKQLQAKKDQINQKTQTQLQEKRATGENLQEVVASYEKLLGGCNTKSARCADVLYTLASLYYDQARDAFVKAKEDYGKAMDEYDRTHKGKEPVNPIPNYSKAIKMYRQLAATYPDFPKIDEAYFQMGTIMLVQGDMDSAKIVYTALINKMPNSVRASSAHAQLAEFAYTDHNLNEALKHLEKVNMTQVTKEIASMVHFRKADIYYNLSEFDKAAELFFSYIEKSDAGEYVKQDLRDESLEMLATTFSDMTNGAQEAINFFHKVGSRPYEATVLYTVGEKNRTHGQIEEAVLALNEALKQFPYYKDAPLAQQMLVECFVLKKKDAEANDAREKLVDTYGPTSEWVAKNAGQKEALANANNEVRKALGTIPLYYLALAQKNKDRSLYEKALQRFNEYFDKFPNDKWSIYQFKFYVAEVYNTLGDFEKAADNYNWVAMANLASFGAYEKEIDTLGMDAQEVEKRKKEAKRPVSISQEDAGYNVVVALSSARKRIMSKQGLNDEQALNEPITKKLLDYVRAFQGRFPKSANSPEVLLLGGDIYYSAKSYENAIQLYKFIIDTYPSSKISDKALRMLANCYASMGEYDMAFARYDLLLKQYSQTSPEYAEIIDLAAGTLFKKAEALKKGGNTAGAAETFKQIPDKYPKSKVADRGWFEAGACYEELNNFDAAASIFMMFTEKYPQSTLVEKAFVRAAEDYKKVNKSKEAAMAYMAGAQKINKQAFAAPSLYYAGYYFEQAKMFAEAIKAYGMLYNNFPTSEFSADAFFSVGICYEKMGKNSEMAGTFTEYAKKFSTDKAKQVEAVVKAGDAYFNMGDNANAKQNYTMAIDVYEHTGKNSEIDVGSIARAEYMLGEIIYRDFSAIQFTGDPNSVKKSLEAKTKLLEECAKTYAKAVEIGVAEWTIKATYKIGVCFVDFAGALENQTIRGNETEKVAARIKIISSLEKYYIKAQEYFGKNIDWAYQQNIKNEYVDKSKDMFVKMGYLKGGLFEQVGLLFKNSPVPAGLSPEDRKAYKELLEEKELEAMDKALPKFEEAVKAAAQLGIVNSPWLDKTREKIRGINPSSEVLSLQIVERAPVVKPQTAQPATPAASVVKGKTASPAAEQAASNDDQYARNMRRIQNVVQMNISVPDKIAKLRQMERDAQRATMDEQERITELKMGK